MGSTDDDAARVEDDVVDVRDDPAGATGPDGTGSDAGAADGPPPPPQGDGGPGRQDDVDVGEQPLLETDEPCNSRVLDVLFRSPPRDEQVLVEGEVVLYKRREHWAMLGRHAARSTALLWLALQLVLGLGGGITAVEGLLTLAALGVVVRWALRRSRGQVLSGVLGVLAGGSVLGMGRYGIGVALLAFAMGYFGKEYVQWRCYRFLYVTDRRVVQTRGIFNRDFATMPMAKITDVRLRVTYWGDVLGFGEFFIESAGQDQALGHLRYLQEAQLFSSTVLRLATNTVSLDELGY